MRHPNPNRANDLAVALWIIALDRSGRRRQRCRRDWGCPPNLRERFAESVNSLYKVVPQRLRVERAPEVFVCVLFDLPLGPAIPAVIVESDGH